MKILLCSDIYPGLGGIAQYCENLSKVLKKEHEIEILSLLYPNQKTKETLNGIPINRLSKQGLDNFFNSKKFDIVIARWYVFLEAATKYQRKVVYIAPSIRATSLKSMGLKKISKNDAVKKEKEGMKKCFQIIYPSEILKKQAKEEYGITKGIVLPHGVDLKKFKPGKEKDFDVLTVANLNDQRKGIDLLLQIAEISNAGFFVLGDGKLKEEYLKIIENKKLKVNLLGRQPSKEYYEKSKIYVLPSRYEAFGLVLLEAMASGLPCIAFKPDGKNIITASDEIIINDKTGFLVKDKKEMAEKINLLLEDKELREKMGLASIKEAKKYSWEKYLKKLLKKIS